MGFVEATKTCLKKYVVVSGRASRSEFWYFYLFTILATIPGAVVDFIFFAELAAEDFGPVESLISLAFLIPTVTVSVRRLHDIGLSGFFIVLPIALLFGGAFAVIWFEGVLNGPTLYAGIAAMVLGFILSLYWMTKKSSPGSNKYGPSPLDGPVTDQLKEVFE